MGRRLLSWKRGKGWEYAAVSMTGEVRKILFHMIFVMIDSSPVQRGGSLFWI